MSDDISLSPATVRPTKKQQELLVFIGAFIKEHGYSPSYREIMNGCQYNSVATVALHVGNLIKRGHLRKRDHSARSIEVVRATPADNGPDRQGQAWLLEQAEQLLAQAEKAPVTATAEQHAVRTLLDACHVLGLDTTKLNQRLEKLIQG